MKKKKILVSTISSLFMIVAISSEAGEKTSSQKELCEASAYMAIKYNKHFQSEANCDTGLMAIASGKNYVKHCKGIRKDVHEVGVITEELEKMYNTGCNEHLFK